MTRSIKDLYGDLPSGLFANDEDDALVKEDNGRYVYKDLSKEISLSYSLSGDNAIKVNKSTLSKHNSSTNFSQSFYVFPDIQDSTPVFSYNHDSTPQTILDIGSLSTGVSTKGGMRAYPFDPWGPHPTINIHENGSLYWTGDSSSFVIADSAGKGIPDPNLTVKPYTIQAFVHDKDTDVNKNQTLVRFGDDVIYRQKDLTWGGVDHAFTSRNNQQNVPNKKEDWEYNGLTFDGYDFKLHRDNQTLDAIRNSDFDIDAGVFRYKDVSTGKDAAFQCKVFFPNNPTSDATLFRAGNGSGYETRIEYDVNYNGLGPRLVVKCMQLSAEVDISSYSFFNNTYRVISWDIKINPARFRVWIDGESVANLSSSSILTDGVWAKNSPSYNSASPITAISVSSASQIKVPTRDINYQAYEFDGDRAGTRPFTSLDANGNILANVKANDRDKYFMIDSKLFHNQNKIYYFEMEYDGPSIIAGDTRYAEGSVRPFLADAGWGSNDPATTTGYPLGDPGPIDTANIYWHNHSSNLYYINQGTATALNEKVYDYVNNTYHVVGNEYIGSTGDGLSPRTATRYTNGDYYNDANSLFASQEYYQGRNPNNGFYLTNLPMKRGDTHGRVGNNLTGAGNVKKRKYSFFIDTINGGLYSVINGGFYNFSHPDPDRAFNLPYRSWYNSDYDPHNNIIVRPQSLASHYSTPYVPGTNAAPGYYLGILVKAYRAAYTSGWPARTYHGNRLGDGSYRYANGGYDANGNQYRDYRNFGPYGRYARVPDQNVKIILNPADWEYDPEDILVNKIALTREYHPTKGFLDGGSPYSFSTGGLSASQCEYAATAASPWYKPLGTQNSGGISGTYDLIDASGYRKLRYFPKAFPSLYSNPLTIGRSALEINLEQINGSDFANDYVARTGGTVRSWPGSYAGNPTLAQYIKSMADGDALLIDPGTYTIHSTANGVANARYDAGLGNTIAETTPFQNSKILICGNTRDPSSVIINYVPYGAAGNTVTPAAAPYSTTTQHVGAIWGHQSDANTGLAFLTLKRDFEDYYKRKVALFWYADGGFAEKVIFDFGGDDTIRPGAYNDRFWLAYEKGIFEYTEPVKNKTFKNCFFKNYGNASTDIAPGSSNLGGRSYNFENCAFSVANAIIGFETQSNINFTGFNIDNATISGNTARLDMFKGYINEFAIQSRVEMDSSEFNSLNLGTDDSSQLIVYNKSRTTNSQLYRKFFIEAKVKSKELLRMDDRGYIYRNKTDQVGTVNLQSDAWNYVVLEWNNSNNTVTITNNAADSVVQSNFFDSFYISDTHLKIGAMDSFNFSRADYDAVYSSIGNSFKDFQVTDSDITTFGDSAEIEFNNNATYMLQKNYFSNVGASQIKGPTPDSVNDDITLAEFSPYTGQDKGWFQYGVVRDGYDSVRMHSGFNNDYLFTYDSNLRDSDIGDFDVQIVLSNTDTEGSPIRWSYKEVFNNNPRRFRLGRDSTYGYNYILRKIIDSSGMSLNHVGYVSFYPQKITMADSHDHPKMMIRQGSGEGGVIYSVAVMYDRFECAVDLGSSTNFVNEFIKVKALDPSLNPKTDFVYPAWPQVSDRSMEIIQNLFDSEGELPV